MVDKRVLIIDDDEDIRFTIMEICRSQQWMAREAADYQEAQTVMKEFSPDVVLVDYHMPVHDKGNSENGSKHIDYCFDD